MPKASAAGETPSQQGSDLLAPPVGADVQATAGCKRPPQDSMVEGAPAKRAHVASEAATSGAKAAGLADSHTSGHSDGSHHPPPAQGSPSHSASSRGPTPPAPRAGRAGGGILAEAEACGSPAAQLALAAAAGPAPLQALQQAAAEAAAQQEVDAAVEAATPSSPAAQSAAAGADAASPGAASPVTSTQQPASDDTAAAAAGSSLGSPATLPASAGARLAGPSPPPRPHPAEGAAAEEEYEAYMQRWQAGTTLQQRWHRLAAAGKLGAIRQAWEGVQEEAWLAELQRGGGKRLGRGRARKEQEELAEVEDAGPRQSRARRAPSTWQDYQVDTPAVSASPAPTGCGGWDEAQGDSYCDPSAAAAAAAHAAYWQQAGAYAGWQQQQQPAAAAPVGERHAAPVAKAGRKVGKAKAAPKAKAAAAASGRVVYQAQQAQAAAAAQAQQAQAAQAQQAHAAALMSEIYRIGAQLGAAAAAGGGPSNLTETMQQLCWQFGGGGGAMAGVQHQ